METHSEIRRTRLEVLCEQHGLKHVADLSGLNWQYIDQAIKKTLLPAKQDGTRSYRKMSDESFEKIEDALKLGRGWFDQSYQVPSKHMAPLHMDAGKTPKQMNFLDSQNTTNLHNNDDVTINQYDVGGGMGGGRLLLEDQPGLIKSWHVDRQWVQMNVKHHTNAGNLCIVTGFGDSMLGMYNPGDPLLVDRGITTCDFDGVYFFRVGAEGYIKRLQRIPGEGILVISENPQYRDWIIKPNMDFQVLAKVVKVWESKQF